MIRTAIGITIKAVYLFASLKNSFVFLFAEELSLENAGSNAVPIGIENTVISAMKFLAALKFPIAMSEVNVASMRFW